MNPIPAKLQMLLLCTSLVIFQISCNSPEITIASGQNILRAFPSPADVQVTIIVSNTQGQMGTLKVFDPEGDLMLSESVSPGEHQFNIDISPSISGKCYVEFQAGTLTATKIFLKR